VAAAVILPQGYRSKRLHGLRDSKQLAPKVRERFASALQQACVWGVGVVEVNEIDALGVGRANRLAMRRALEELSMPPTYALVDALTIAGAICPTEGIAGGDERVLSIAAASIIAKVIRDRMMEELHTKDRRYGFHLHKGYGTKLHQARLARYGPSKHHRRSFCPVRNFG
jgi:ribonuclease HII